MLWCFKASRGLSVLRSAGRQAFFLTGLTLAAPASHGMDTLSTVDDLLRQLSQAVQERNYRGRFTYEYGGALDTLEVVHVVRDGLEYERLQHLSGPSREVVRKGRPTSCVNTGGFLLRGGVFAPSAATDAGVRLNQHYHFYIRGEERVAGRVASLVQIAPKDDDRYGLTLAIDNISGLPLMWLSTSAQQKVLERLQFVELQLEPPINEQDLAPITRQYLALTPQSSPCAKSAQEPARWSLGWLPSGFVLAQVEHPQDQQEILTYTDGIASFSVFIKPVASLEGVRRGLAMRGATLALMSGFTAENKAYSLVLTGEIPPQTAQQILATIEPGKAGS